MFNKQKIKGLMVEKNITGKEMAEKMNIVPDSFYRKMKKGIFNSDEVEIMIRLLGVDNPNPIFFVPPVNLQETKKENK